MSPQDRVDQRLRRLAGIPPKYVHTKIEDYDPARGDAQALATVTDYVANLEQHRKTGRGLLLMGPPGHGKTMLGCAVLNAALDAGHAVHFETLAGWIRKCQDDIRDEKRLDRGDDAAAYARTEAHRVLAEQIHNQFRFLLLDDVGKEHATASRYAADTFDFIVRERFNHGLPTILTTNLPLKRWSTAYTESMVSLVHESTIFVAFGGADYRMAVYGGRQ